MRIIKFRAQQEGNGGWVFGDISHVQRIVEKGCKPQIRIAGYNVDEDTIGQFIGIYDAKGIEIYDGDIIKIESNLFVVVYMDCGYKAISTQYYGRKDADCHAIPVSASYQSFYRVVGNIYDNDIDC